MDELNAPAEPQQDELWLISYADLLSLLVGFFIMIIAAVPLRQAAFERIAASISGSKSAPLQQLRERAEGLGIEFKDALLFDSASADVRQEGQRAIAEVARLLRALPGRPVLVEGHTDEVPIRTAHFHSNWELSSQRAINVLAALEAGGIPRERLSARAFADTRPRDVQGTIEERRLANRRVVVRVE